MGSVNVVCDERMGRGVCVWMSVCVCVCVCSARYYYVAAVVMM